MIYINFKKELVPQQVTFKYKIKFSNEFKDSNTHAYYLKNRLLFTN